MPRPTWEPTTDQQRAALDAIDKAVAEANEIKAKADAEAATMVRQAIEKARGLGVPMREVVKRVGAGRATIYRRLGKSEPDARTDETEG